MKYIPYLAYQKCCGCQANLRNKYYNRSVRRVNEQNIQSIRSYFKNISINVGNYICNKCQNRVKKKTKNEISRFNKNKCISDTKAANSSDEDNTLSSIDVNNHIIKKKTILLPTAYGSHKKCIFCNRLNGLHIVKAESIMYAYVNHGIIIKHESRCCNDHFDDKGLIKAEEFNYLVTTDKPYEKDLILVLDSCLDASKKIQSLLKDSSGIFDKFRDMAALDDALCLKITGWTKVQFNTFSNYIKNVRDTCGRTKEQLIAIYRYWLSKGIDQCTLAMLKCNTTQQQISHYLAQIRQAMNDEFVPLFLGANKGKKFFLQHNNESVKILHELENDVLAIIVDGTYTRLEKSSNNDFQYLSYSMQKSHNLIKPFIICCADGYFIDCYGPFQANLNDAQIFNNILTTDKDLNMLFTPSDKIILFLDRGKPIKLNKYLFNNLC